MSISNYPLVTGCELVSNIYNTNYNFDDVFNNNTPYNYPSLIISGDKLKQQNQDIYNKYMDHGLLVVNNDPSCEVDFNIRNLNNSTNLQKGYSRNIDLDSELKRINHITDKCYYDNYKYHPDEALKGNGLYCHRNALIKDYTAVGKPIECAKPLTLEHKSVILPGHLHDDYKKPFAETMSTREVNYGYHTTGDYPPTERMTYQGCTYPRPDVKKPEVNPWQQWTKCDNNAIFQNDTDAKMLHSYKHNISGNSINHYRFNGDINNQSAKFTKQFPCQRLFNNNTKRSTLRNFHNLYDINPTCLE